MIQQISAVKKNGYNKEPEIVYRYRGCNNNLTSNDPASQYQRQKIIQNTVRVPSSLFTMNLGALSVYQRPDLKYRMVDISGSTYIVSPGVNWNQMSDRKEPHIQVATTASGSTYHSSSTKRTITGPRPGAMSPGGAGVDIKHNSYDRYLNRLKGKAPLRRGVIPPDFGIPYIPFSRAYPIYGGKVMKTSIVNKCNCPIEGDNSALLYNNSDIQDEIFNVKFEFQVGDYVYATKVCDDSGRQYKAQIISIEGEWYTVKFQDGTIEILPGCALHIYFDCSNCVNPEYESDSMLYKLNSDQGTAVCEIFSALSDGQIV